MLYIKKPVVVEAVRYDGFNKDNNSVLVSEKPQWLDESFGETVVFSKEKDTLIINTLEGEMTVSVGDYIIKGINDELYPCKPDIFTKTYEQCFNNNAK